MLLTFTFLGPSPPGEGFGVRPDAADLHHSLIFKSHVNNEVERGLGVSTCNIESLLPKIQLFIIKFTTKGIRHEKSARYKFN